MEQTNRLSISLNWHPTHYSIRRCFQDLNTHLLAEFTAAARRKEIQEFVSLR
jgi:hypothetical protein